MRKLWIWITIIVGFLWWALTVIGNLDAARNLIAHRSEIVKVIFGFATAAPWWMPTGIFIIGLLLLICIEFDLLPRQRAELIPFITKIDRFQERNLRMRIGIKNTTETSLKQS